MRRDLASGYYRPVQQAQTGIARSVGRIERAPVRGKPVRVDVSVRFPLPPPEKPKPEPRPLRRAKAYGLLVVNTTGGQPTIFRSKPLGAWQTYETDNTTFRVHNKGRVISAANGIADFSISQDDGRSFTSKTAPGSGITMHDRSPDGRYWVLADLDGQVYFSDDLGDSWSATGDVLNLGSAWGISAHPTDSDRVAVFYEDGDSGAPMVYVTANHGASWSAKAISALSTSDIPDAIWLPSGRIAVLAVVSPGGDELVRTYSDDDGDSWATAVQLTTKAAGAGAFDVPDMRISRDGYLFAIVNIEAGVSSHATLRSADGDSFDVLGPHRAERAHAIAFSDLSSELFIGYAGDHIYRIRGAKTLDSGDWVTASIELADLPTDIMQGGPNPNMVVI